jgi:nucleotide-binding universal stress UspA family protein
MKSVQVVPRVELKNILFLTDFSDASEAALPFAIAVAREHGSTVHALHVLIPDAFNYTTVELGNLAMEAQEECADNSMRRVDAQLTGLPHHTSVVRGFGIWPIIEQLVSETPFDLIVLGTHGRTGAQKALMGSAAEEIFRKSPIPVMTIGPSVRHGAHSAARFRRVLFATDFSKHAQAALRYAISFALENRAELTLLHAIPDKKNAKAHPSSASVAEALHALHELIPPGTELQCRPEPLVRCDQPAVAILESAEQCGADLIVLGIRGAQGVPGASTHLDRSIAHKIVVFAECPVLTVRG